MTVTANVIQGRQLINLHGLKAGPVAFYTEGYDELLAVLRALTEAASLHVHLPDGCEDDSCPCYARGAGR